MARAKALGAQLWPSELSDVRDVLSLYPADGRGPLPKGTLASVFEATLGMRGEAGERRPSDRGARRTLGSAVLLCAIALAGFARERNHSAEIDGWTVFAARAPGLAHRYDLPASLVRPSVDLATTAGTVEGVEHVRDRVGDGRARGQARHGPDRAAPRQRAEGRAGQRQAVQRPAADAMLRSRGAGVRLGGPARAAAIAPPRPVTDRRRVLAPRPRRRSTPPQCSVCP